MKVIELFFITNIIFLFFITVYYIFFEFKDKFRSNDKKIYYSLTVLLIVFLLIYLYNKFNIKTYICFFTITLLLLFHHKDFKLTLLVSLIEFIYCYKILLINPLFLIFLLISYYVIYYLYISSSKDYFYLTNLFAIDTSMFIILYSFIFKNISYDYIVIVILYLISIYLITFYINKLKNIIKIYSSLEEIGNNKEFKTAIFKVTHEIKNPLAVIKGYLDIFDSNDSEKCERYRNILLKEVDNSLLVLKDFSSLNNLSVSKYKMNFNDLLNEIKDTILPFFNDKNIKLNIESESNLIIKADYNRLKQVFINILKNSTEAIDNNGIININSYKSNDNLIVIIKDNGCGMDKDTIDNLFTPFYSKKNYGTGLGLCLSKEIIELHGGSIEYSSLKNSYTKVKIVIPVM